MQNLLLVGITSENRIICGLQYLLASWTLGLLSFFLFMAMSQSDNTPILIKLALLVVGIASSFLALIWVLIGVVSFCGAIFNPINSEWRPSFQLTLISIFLFLATIGLFLSGPVSDLKSDGLNYVWYTKYTDWFTIQITNWHVFMAILQCYGYVAIFKQFKLESLRFKRNKTD